MNLSRRGDGAWEPHLVLPVLHSPRLSQACTHVPGAVVRCEFGNAGGMAGLQALQVAPDVAPQWRLGADPPQRDTVLAGKARHPFILLCGCSGFCTVWGQDGPRTLQLGEQGHLTDADCKD